MKRNNIGVEKPLNKLFERVYCKMLQISTKIWNGYLTSKNYIEPMLH